MPTVAAIAGSVLRNSEPAAIPSATANSANAIGKTFWVSNCAPSNRLPYRELGVPDHHVTSALTAAAITSVAASGQWRPWRRASGGG